MICLSPGYLQYARHERRYACGIRAVSLMGADRIGNINGLLTYHSFAALPRSITGLRRRALRTGNCFFCNTGAITMIRTVVDPVFFTIWTDIWTDDMHTKRNIGYEFIITTFRITTGTILTI